MSAAEIEQLVADRSLARQSFSDDDVVQFWREAPHHTRTPQFRDFRMTGRFSGCTGAHSRARSPFWPRTGCG